VSLDLLVHGGAVLTMDAERRVIADGAVGVRGGTIVSVGPRPATPPAAARTIDARGCAVLPGLVNAHTHAIQILLRGGLSQDLGLFRWLSRVIGPGLAAYTAGDARAAARLFCWEALRGGITTFVDNGDAAFRPELVDATLDVYRELGVRAIYGRMFRDRAGVASADETYRRFTEAMLEPGPAVLDHVERLARAYPGGGDALLSVWPAPATPLAVTPETLAAAADLARRHGGRLTCHCAEPEPTGARPGQATEPLVAAGALGGDLQLAHCVWVDDVDIERIAAAGAGVVHLPQSNMYLAVGVAPVARMLARGIAVGLGTDDANCNDRVDLLAECKAAALLARVASRRPDALPAERVLEMATLGGARALGRERALGSIEAGKQADLAVFPLDDPGLVPHHHLPGTLVYQGPGLAARAVVVAGRILLADGQPTWLDAADRMALLHEGQRRSAEIVERAGLGASVPPGWRAALTTSLSSGERAC
jgi:atrazine chlorohydrolase/5-methylthioadenosine/S-adenosylhomocysteine deaminase/melamine deaminase